MLLAADTWGLEVDGEPNANRHQQPNVSLGDAGMPTALVSAQDNPLDYSELTTCRYGDTAFPEPGQHVPQQIHIMPAGERSTAL